MGILEGRTAIIIGASSGVGYGTALRFAEEGADVIAGARRLERLEKLKAEAAERGFAGSIVPVRMDVANEEDLDTAVRTAVDLYGKIDILACIAQGGLNEQRVLMETTKEACMNSYLTGPVYSLLMIQKCFPYMKEQGYGRILLTASGAAFNAPVGTTAYGMAKAAVVDLTRYAAQELGRYGITVNCFTPVLLNDHFGVEGEGPVSAEMVAAHIPVGYMGDPYKDGSPLLAFLVSEQAHYINGQIISVCGGVDLHIG